MVKGKIRFIAGILLFAFCAGILNAHACMPDFHSDQKPVGEIAAFYDCAADCADESSKDSGDDCNCVDCACACHGNLYFPGLEIPEYRLVSGRGNIAVRDDVARSEFLGGLMRPPRA